jgi:hypothetical protein
MRKSILLTSVFIILFFHYSCQSRTRNSASLVGDSAALVFPNDTLSHSRDTSAMKDTASANINATSTSGHVSASKGKRIEHGSANQAQLDSIKRAKTKQKK